MQVTQIEIEEYFDTKTVADIAGIEYRTLIRWISEYKLLVPAIKGRGQGSKHYFNRKQLREVAMFAALRSVVSLQKLRLVRNRLKKMGHNPFSSGEFLVYNLPKGQKGILKIEKGKILDLLDDKDIKSRQLKLFPAWELERRLRSARPAFKVKKSD